MSWFDEQIRERIKKDENMFADAYADMINSVSKKKIVYTFQSDKETTKKALTEILSYYHTKETDMMQRRVKLTGKWYRDAYGAMLAKKKDGCTIALIPNRCRGYSYNDYGTGEKIRVTKKNAAEIKEEAVCFYTPFPMKKIEAFDLIKYMFHLFTTVDYLRILLLAFAVTLTGLFVPFLTKYLYGVVIDSKNVKLLMAVMTAMLCILLSGGLFTLIKDIFNDGIKARLGLAVESAAMIRVLSLPPHFFRKYSAGELANRMGYLNRMSGMLFDVVFSTGLTALLAFIYLGQIVSFASGLVLPALMVTFLTVLISLATAFLQMRLGKKKMEAESGENGLSYALIHGVEKIKSTGAEKRAFAKWANRYAACAKYTYNPPAMIKLNGAFTLAVTSIGTVIMYYYAIHSGVSVSDYMAFISAYSLVNGAFTALLTATLQSAEIKPMMEMVKPILETEPETVKQKSVITRLSGSLELNNVSFRYDDDMPYVLNNVSLKIRSGQYVAIVGKTGCGKSTLMRLLLGFEKPEKGAVYYDGRDIASLDLKSLRSKIGVVMQNGKLFQGDIFSNISIAAPNLSMEDAWEAVRLAGMEDEIRSMPMGMRTVLSEGQGGISGGQKQRLLIARAIAPKPKILMFDEATSALDNVTQRMISQSLEQLKCTRIVIAHRLSTIKNCDRILVLEDGQITEDGTYEELLKKQGFFADLVRRQQIENP